MVRLGRALGPRQWGMQAQGHPRRVSRALMPRSPAEIPTDPLSTTSRALHDTTLRFGTFPLNASNLSIFARTKSDLMPTLLVHAVHLRSGRAKGNGVVWEEHTDRIADTGQGCRRRQPFLHDTANDTQSRVAHKRSISYLHPLHFLPTACTILLGAGA